MLNFLLIVLIIVGIGWILDWAGSIVDACAYKDSKKGKVNNSMYYPVVNTTKTTTIKSMLPRILLPGEREEPPCACLFGKNEAGDFNSEGAPEPEYLTDVELNVWSNKKSKTALEVIDIQTKRRAIKEMQPIL